MREFIGQTEVGKMSEEDLLALEQRALPTYGTCAMLGTANSMSFLSEILGLALPHSTTAPAVSSEKRRYAKEAGKRILGLIQENLTARKILTRKNLLNSIRAVMAMGASTNTVLHLMAIAHEAQVELSLDDFDRISREIPYLCNLKPSGEYPMEAFHEAGGVQTVLKALETKLDLDQLTITGKTLGANLKEVSFADGPVIHSLDHPKKPEGGIAILYGNLAPKGAVVKKAGVKPSMYQFTGTARVFNYMEDACRAIQAGEIPAGTVIVLRYEGPKGGPGMREQHMVTSLLVGRGMDESCALITDGRFSGSTRGPAIGHISPEAAAGGPIATVQDGDTITIDIPGRKLTLHLSAEEIQKRLAQVQLLRKPATPALQKYAALVTSADRGAILEIPECLK